MPQRRRVIYFDIDSLRPDHLGCYGYARPTSPSIDRIAAEGARFEIAYTSDSPCMPSRCATVTCRMGIHNGVVTHGGALSMGLAHLVDGHYSEWGRVMDNCAVSELVVHPRPEVLSFNLTDHLEGV